MPKSPRTTDHPFGKKLLLVLAEQGRVDDLEYLAESFGVKVQSVYDWINHGRFAKDRYARLVEWSGRTLHWWFDLPERPAWPFPGIEEDWFCSLGRDAHLSFQGGLQLQAAQMGIDLRNGTHG